MNPVINKGKAAEALDMYKEIIKFGPPGAEAMDLGTTIQRWVAGSDVMSVWWIDLAEFSDWAMMDEDFGKLVERLVESGR